MKATLYEYTSPALLRPSYQIITEDAPPGCEERERDRLEREGGAPVTARRVAVTDVRDQRRAKRAVRWFGRVIERRAR